jgi:SEC-C motif-containing protein
MNRKNTTTALSHCPCGAGSAYSACCGQYLSQSAIPHHAEALMRSRYTAYTLEHDEYLLATWHPSTRPATLDFLSEPRRKWLGLTVKRHEQSPPSQAIVEFVAHFKIGGRAHRLHEISRFVCENGRWLYVDGDMI